MSAPSFDRLVEVMRCTFGQPGLTVTRETTSEQVPGWDSINHSILMMEIDSAFGVMLEPDVTAKLANVGELYDMLLAETARSGQTG